MLALPVLLIACNQKKAEPQKADDAGGEVTEVAKAVTAAVIDGEQDKAKPGDEFIKTAKQYQEKSVAAREAGDSEKAGIYSKLADIKMEAAAAANEGKSYDWTRYHELVKELE